MEEEFTGIEEKGQSYLVGEKNRSGKIFAVAQFTMRKVNCDCNEIH